MYDSPLGLEGAFIIEINPSSTYSDCDESTINLVTTSSELTVRSIVSKLIPYLKPAQFSLPAYSRKYIYLSGLPLVSVI